MASNRAHQIERAFNGWRDGDNLWKLASDTGNKSLAASLYFNAESWAPLVKDWAKSIRGEITEKRWDVIIIEAAVYINPKAAAVILEDSHGAPTAAQGVREAVQVSDDECL